MLKSYGKEQMDTKMLGYLGVTLKDSDVTYVTIDGYYQWADYGTRSIVLRDFLRVNSPDKNLGSLIETLK